MSVLPVRTARRYLQPLREGGSLPAVVDTDDGAFVVKFRGAGQGAKALVAELIVGSLARAAGLPVPEIALVDVSPEFGRGERDPEIQDLLRASHGLNVGLRYLDGAFNFDPSAAGDLVTTDFATRLVWLDALVINPDRTHRNPNLLVWKDRVWLIDHGSALYMHHDWSRVDESHARAPFARIREHVLLDRIGDLAAEDERLAAALDAAAVDDAIATVPDALLESVPDSRTGVSATEQRARYRRWLIARLERPRAFVNATLAARVQLEREPRRPLSARR